MKPYVSPWLDDDLLMLRDAISRYVESEMLPLDRKWRKQHQVDKEAWRKIGAAGFLCLDIPAEYGGGGGDFRHAQSSFLVKQEGLALRRRQRLDRLQ